MGHALTSRGVGVTPASLATVAAEARHATTPSGTSASPPAVEEVAVTADLLEQTLRDAPMNVHVLSGREIEQRGVENLVELTRAVPGPNVTKPRPGQNRIYIRSVASPDNLSWLIGVCAAADLRRYHLNTQLSVFAHRKLERFAEIPLGDSGVQDSRAAFGEGPRPRTFGAKIAASF